MDKENAKNKKKKKDRLDISARGIIDNLVFSKREVKAYYQISNKPYDFLSQLGKVQSAKRTVNAFGSLMNERMKEVEGEIIMTSLPVDVDTWVDQMYTVSEDYPKPEGFKKYINDLEIYLKNADYHKKVTYIGISLGKRGVFDKEDVNFLELGFEQAKENLKNWLTKGLKLSKEEFSEEEEKLFKNREKELFNTLANGNLEARRVTSEEILLLIKRPFYPAMPTPYLNVDHENRIGLGDIVYETAHIINSDRYRYLEITQDFGEHELTGYRSCLSITKIPKHMSIPQQEPFMYLLSKLGLPFTTFIKFKLTPHSKIKKDLNKVKKAHDDELDNINTARQSAKKVTTAPTISSDFQEAIDEAAMIEEIISNDKTPWIEASYHIVVETPTVETLKKYCSIVIQEFKDNGILVSQTGGDQIDLFLMQLPGDFIRVSDFMIKNDLNILGIAGINYVAEVGDLLPGEESFYG